MAWLNLLLYSSLILPVAFSRDDSNLLLVQILFRHGDRAPVQMYPTDPNAEDSWPEGLGKLTLLGVKQQYALGKFLRRMYDNFITGNPNEVFVKSSASERCLTSAEANLAAFYGHQGRWNIEDDLNWKPVHIHYLPPHRDKYLSYKAECPRATAEMEKQLESEQIQELYQKYQRQLEHLSYSSGLNVTQGINALYLLDTLLVEKKHNLRIPEWADRYWDVLKEISASVFHSFLSSPVLQTLLVGPLLQDIAQNMKRKINGEIPDLKVQMYSAHEVHVAGVLMALNFTNMPRPPYCATLIFELHEMSNATMAVRLLYLNSTDPPSDVEAPHILVLDGCSEFCPVEKFTKKFQHLIPDDWEQECQPDTSNTSETDMNEFYQVIQYDK